MLLRLLSSVSSAALSAGGWGACAALSSIFDLFEGLDPCVLSSAILQSTSLGVGKVGSFRVSDQGTQDSLLWESLPSHIRFICTECLRLSMRKHFEAAKRPSKPWEVVTGFTRPMSAERVITRCGEEVKFCTSELGS